MGELSLLVYALD